MPTHCHKNSLEIANPSLTQPQTIILTLTLAQRTLDPQSRAPDNSKLANLNRKHSETRPIRAQAHQ